MFRLPLKKILSVLIVTGTVLFIPAANVMADITLDGQIHLGDEEGGDSWLSSLKPDDPIPYAKIQNYPIHFQLTSPAIITQVTLNGLTEANKDGFITVYLDGINVGTVNGDGSTIADTIDITDTSLTTGVHKIAFAGLVSTGTFSDGEDDFDFDSITLTTSTAGTTTNAINLIERHHYGDDNGNDDDYHVESGDADDEYPDNDEGTTISFTITLTDTAAGIQLNFFRLRSLDYTSTITWDGTAIGSLTPGADTVDNSDDPYTVDHTFAAPQSIGSHTLVISLHKECTFWFLGSCLNWDYDDISWDELIIVPANIDHFAVSHDGSAINCMAENITISAHDASHNIYTGYDGTITLSTSTGHGDWSIGSGNGTLTDATADDGSATYTFVAADNGTAILQLKDTHVETVNIDVVDGGVSETSGAALAAEDADLVFAETGFVFYGNSTLDNIGSQICGKNSSVGFGSQVLEIAAVRTNDNTGACEAALVGDTTVEIGFECRNPVACTANHLQINGVNSVNLNGVGNGASQTYSNVTLNFGTDADYTAPFSLNYLDAGLIRLHARYNIPLQNGSPSGTYMTGTSNEFISRPFGFLVDDNLGYVDTVAACSGSTCHVAGQNFPVSLTAWCLANLADDGNSNGIPDIFEDDDPANLATITNNSTLDTTYQADNFGNESTSAANAGMSINLIAPSGGDSGTFSAANVDFADGAGSITNANWDEVGIITLQADTSNYFSSAVTGRSAMVGRFIPFRLDLSANTPEFNFFCDDGTVQFTYVGQDFGFLVDPVITVTGLNSNGSTTNNYGNSFWKLNSGLTNRSYSNNAATAATLSRTTDGGAATLAGDNDYDGSGTLTISGDKLTYARPATPESPFLAAVDLTLSPADLTDSDNVCYDFDTDASCDSFTISNITGSAYNNWGRMSARNNYGPEDEDLSIPLVCQYYDAGNAAFVTNIYDVCTRVTLALSNFTDNLASGETCVQDSGAPGASNQGCAVVSPASEQFAEPPVLGDFNLYLKAPGSGNEGTVTITVNEETGGTWLRYDWDNDGNHDNVPTAIATFGIFRGNDRIINWQEITR